MNTAIETNQSKLLRNESLDVQQIIFKLAFELCCRHQIELSGKNLLAEMGGDKDSGNLEAIASWLFQRFELLSLEKEIAPKAPAYLQRAANP